ncbi:alpha/beta fold hydrolase [Hymenobacter negativus]|uniref:Alpha/beta fold hydrolase n=1 Tax=Hymenobacter negativus TaxID=2795026 RepID=A0ABS3QCW4_9BACT|nr:alpha/beta fold hydrolase [Hymenobacter negativus]MBO2009046.1 alpha/beta fold hydrolase [Hymenobacter negativus]
MNTTSSVKKCLWELLMLALLAGRGYGQQLKSRDVRREDFIVAGQAGELSVRRVTIGVPVAGRRVLLLVHGGGAGGVASFDLAVPGGSLAADLAERGLTVYVLNIRGWGGSADPPVGATDTTCVNLSCREAADDIAQVVQAVRRRERVQQVALFGWASGGHWAGYYASHHPRRVSHFISLNALYGVRAPWRLRPGFARPTDSTHFNRALGPWRMTGVAGMSPAVWDQLIPVADKAQWRDPAVARAYAETAVALDRGSSTRTPPTLRVPGGWREESFYQSLGATYWRAQALRMPVLALRGELDFWSRPADLAALAAALPPSGRHRTVSLPLATHFVFLDRADKGRDQLLREIVDFLQ